MDIGAYLIHGLALRPDGKMLFVTVESDHTLRIRRYQHGRDQGHHQAHRTAQRVRGDPDGKYVAVPIRMEIASTSSMWCSRRW